MRIRSHSIAVVAAVLSTVAITPAQAGLVTWIGPTGFWDVAGNWTPGVPLAGDTVVINVAGPQTVTFRAPTVINVGSLAAGNASNLDSMAITGGQLTVTGSYSCAADTSISGSSVLVLNGASILNTLTQSSGSLGGTGTASINGVASFTFGDHRGNGTTILNGPSTISASGLRLDGGRTMQNNSTLTWSGGQILFNNTFNGASGGAGSGTINNAGSGLFVADAGGATSIVASNFGGSDTGADALFSNGGTVRKRNSLANHTTNVDVAFNNAGTVDVQTGILNLSRGGTHTGTFAIAAGAVMSFGGGTHTINGGSATSSGTARVTASIVNVNVPFAFAGILEIQNGQLSLAGNTSAASLVQSNGSISGTGTLTVSGPAAFTFGDHRGAGNTVLNGPTSISSSGLRLDGGRTLQNNNTLTWTGGQILFNNTFNGASGGPGSGTFNNAPGGVFVVDGDSATSVTHSNFGGGDTGADASFNNAGTLRKQNSSPASTTTFDVALSNTGTLDVQTGTIHLPDNFVNAGTLMGSGTLETTVLTNSGHVAPGNPVGNLKLTGNFVQLASGAVDMDFSSCVLFDSFTVSGTAALAGTLHVTFQGCAPVPGTSFTVLNAASVSGGFNQLVVTGGPPGVAFTLSNLATSVVLNAVVGVTPPTLTGVVSRKTHGAAGPFDLPVSATVSNPSTEPRGGAAYALVFTFNKAVTAGTAAIAEGSAVAGPPSFSGAQMTVPLTSVSNAQFVTVTVNNVSATDGGSGGSGSARLGILVGDVNQSRTVSLADLGLVNAQLAQPVTAANFTRDVNVSGTLSVADKSLTNAALTSALPPP